MNSKSKDIDNLIGKRFGNLVVIEQCETKRGVKRNSWVCKCDCGNGKEINGKILINKQAKSCGCMHYKSLKKYNDYTINGNTVSVVMTNTKDVMLCDLEDWNTMKEFCWSVSITGYAEARISGKNRHMHALLIEAPKGYVRDHINRNKLDNRRENIRVVPYSVNNINKTCRNKYGIPGAYKTRNKISVRIHVDGVTIFLGTFDNANDALIARRNAEIKYYGMEMS